jgi:NAD+ kinase
MNRFLIVTNDGKDTDYKVTNKIKHLLEEAGKTCILCEKDGSKRIIKESIPEDIDCAIVIGGDGSLIEASRALQEYDIPILGVNMGTLGYLTEVEVSHIEEAVEMTCRFSKVWLAGGDIPAEMDQEIKEFLEG